MSDTSLKTSLVSSEDPQQESTILAGPVAIIEKADDMGADIPLPLNLSSRQSGPQNALDNSATSAPSKDHTLRGIIMQLHKQREKVLGEDNGNRLVAPMEILLDASFKILGLLEGQHLCLKAELADVAAERLIKLELEKDLECYKDKLEEVTPKLNHIDNPIFRDCGWRWMPKVIVDRYDARHVSDTNRVEMSSQLEQAKAQIAGEKELKVTEWRLAVCDFVAATEQLFPDSMMEELRDESYYSLTKLQQVEASIRRLCIKYAASEATIEQLKRQLEASENREKALRAKMGKSKEQTKMNFAKVTSKADKAAEKAAKDKDVEISNVEAKYKKEANRLKVEVDELKSTVASQQIKAGWAASDYKAKQEELEEAQSQITGLQNQLQDANDAKAAAVLKQKAAERQLQRKSEEAKKEKKNELNVARMQGLEAVVAREQKLKEENAHLKKQLQERDIEMKEENALLKKQLKKKEAEVEVERKGKENNLAAVMSTQEAIMQALRAQRDQVL